jgi:phosphatidylserine/phosphatidylglycerophosphate/cardiolipin synthase-like enzyme
MPTQMETRSIDDGLTLTMHRGDEAVLLAFDLDQQRTPHLAGFAVRLITPDGKSHQLLNRLSFAIPITRSTTQKQRQFHPSNEAPFQKFRWIHVPPEIVPGPYTYEVTAMYFVNGTTKLKAGPTTAASLELGGTPGDFDRFQLGFTRGFLSSQAYASRFGNADIRPPKPTIDFDSDEFQKRWAWLGYHARRLIFDMLAEAREDPALSLDVMAYDLSEPDFIRALQALGPRLRIVIDDSKEHVKPTALEPKARRLLEKSAGKPNVVLGNFSRFAHNKVMVLKRNGTPVKVLTGSTNFSVRGLYAQANNVLVIDDATVAELFERVFEQTFTDMKGFRTSDLAADWFEVERPQVPPFAVSFAPHPSETVSLEPVADAIRRAKSSVLYAIMAFGTGTGPVLEALRDLTADSGVFWFGMRQSSSGVSVVKPDRNVGQFADFAFLKDQVPKPFQAEVSGGLGQVIHHKFVVVDFNDSKPVVFTGSSNLAAGGEKANGDNLLAIRDASIATAYAVEAVRLVDHYQFRVAMRHATSSRPLVLKGDEARWWAPYYDETDAKFRDRHLFQRMAGE